ncbi:toll/interleukin-1 receptor domain-containing protein [Chitinophaga sp. CF418]|uniref:toll/interleukin-1 receptor domain-containing protein n=1 Tax=Chitinophaga sp. CF418 TaxID=1855287 RepID=UPI00090EFA24|nr:toll/interleukin-1 receptor domain-containing protein [Chitinophaga sp. CF418]SHN45341.1 TIR domain-containing protein [Chitinophaga sp. CF418]
MSKAFISHSSVQKPLVETLIRRIGRDNCIVDKYNFEAGQPTLDLIIQGIERTDLFVLLISNEALNSTWVQDEIKFARNLRDKDIARQLLLLNIDPNISHMDDRIPDWLRKEYNLKPIPHPALIYKKISSKLRDVTIHAHPLVEKMEEIFIGRRDVMDEFDRKYFNIKLTKPSVITASGFEGVGRRKFLNNALDKAGRLNKFHEPLSIVLDTRDSIEDFILRIEDQNGIIAEEVLMRIKDATLEEKLLYAKRLLLSFQEQDEILYVIDKGCIIQPNKETASWFEDIIKSPDFNNNTIVCLITSFRSYNTQLHMSGKVISFHINELNPSDRQVLFVKYCDLLDLKPAESNIETILPALNGMPKQIFFTTLLIKDHGSEYVARHIDEIRKYEDFKVFNIIEQIKEENGLAYDILVFVSRFEFVSFDMVYKIFGRNDDVDSALEKIYIYGAYDMIGTDKEYIKVHHAIMDYIMRARIDYSLDVKRKLRKEINTLISNQPDFPDVSEILVTIRSIIQDGGKIPENYFIPSVALRTIIDHYYAQNFVQVYQLATRMLANHYKYHDAIIREIKYWHCLALAKQRNDEFFDYIGTFHGVDHHFLLGFFRRCQKRFGEAEKHFLAALQADPDSQKSKRELVLVLLSQGKYGLALDTAKKNYEKRKLNAFHIQAYFNCLLRKNSWSPSEKQIIDELMTNIKKSHDFRANEIFQVMSGEYEYYINGNFELAVKQLNEGREKSAAKNYFNKALFEIYKRRGMTEKENYYSRLINDEDEDFI